MNRVTKSDRCEKILSGEDRQAGKEASLDSHGNLIG